MSFAEMVEQGTRSLSASAQTLTLFPNFSRREELVQILDQDPQAGIEAAWASVWDSFRQSFETITQEPSNDRNSRNRPTS